jgi:hypothetical protein
MLNVNLAGSRTGYVAEAMTGTVSTQNLAGEFCSIIAICQLFRLNRLWA